MLADISCRLRDGDLEIKFDRQAWTVVHRVESERDECAFRNPREVG